MQENDDNAKPSNQGGKEDKASGTNHDKRQADEEASLDARKKLKGANAEAKRERVSATRDLTGCTSSSME